MESLSKSGQGLFELDSRSLSHTWWWTCVYSWEMRTYFAVWRRKFQLRADAPVVHSVHVSCRCIAAVMRTFARFWETINHKRISCCVPLTQRSNLSLTRRDWHPFSEYICTYFRNYRLQDLRCQFGKEGGGGSCVIHILLGNTSWIRADVQIYFQIAYDNVNLKFNGTGEFNDRLYLINR